jgi:hypothetical protein
MWTANYFRQHPLGSPRSLPTLPIANVDTHSPPGHKPPIRVLLSPGPRLTGATPLREGSRSGA